MKYLSSLLFFFIFLPISKAQNLTKLSYLELDSIIAVFYQKRDYEKAIPFFEIAREKSKKEFGDQDSLYATYTEGLGFFYRQIGEYQKTEPLYLEAKAIFEKTIGKENFYYTNFLNTVAMFYKVIGDYSQAELFYTESMNINSKILDKNSPERILGLQNLAILLSEIEKHQQAELLLLEALAINEKNFGKEHPNYATTLNHLGLLYSELNKIELAEKYLLESKRIREKTLGKTHPDYAVVLNNLAIFYNNIREYDKAEALYIESKNIREKLYGKDHISYATSLNNLAIFYQDCQKYDKAEKLLLEANQIWKKKFGTEHPTYARSLNNLAVFYAKTKQFDLVLNYTLLGIESNCATIDSTFHLNNPSNADLTKLDQHDYYSIPTILESFRLLSVICKVQYKTTGDRKSLEDYYQFAQTAMRFNERIRNNFTNESDKLRNLSTNNEFMLQGIKSAVLLDKEEYILEAFNFAEQNKSVLLMDAVKTERAYTFGDLPDSLAREEKAFQKEYAKIQAALLENGNKNKKDSLYNVLNDLTLKINHFKKNIETKFPKYAALKYEQRSAISSDIQTLLDKETALIEFLIGDSAVYIFYLDKSNVKLFVNPIHRDSFKQNILLLHQALSDYKMLSMNQNKNKEQYTLYAHWFYNNLLKKALNQAKGITRLVIIPDGELGHLPFESFLVEPASKNSTQTTYHYLIQDYAISYNYSATLWKENKSQPPHQNNGQFFALAANYSSKSHDSRTETLRTLRDGLANLPEARNEVELLSQSFAGFFAFDTDATEKNFKEKASDYAIIHLAMHGLLDAKNPILSSLAFTEDGDSIENNFLQAYEISKMKLNADLVVLSACETGYGRFEKGNGIASLAQAFAYAGAPAMIVSLWQVNDFATSEIMKNLYQNLANGMNKDQALQEAKIKYLKEAQGIAAHPAFWSPFILMGNTDAVELKTKGSYWIWALGTLAVLGLGIIALFFKNKKKESAA